MTVASTRWIKSPAWDLVWVLNPVWLVPLVLFLARGHGDARTSPVDTLFFALTVPLWLGHRFSSTWLAYATPAYRPLLAAQPLRFVVAPLAIGVTCFAAMLAPRSVLPMPVTERVVWLAVLDYLLVSQHFAAQHFGLLSLYRARAGRAPDGVTRRVDFWFALVVGGGFVVLADALSGSIAYQERWIDPLLGLSGLHQLGHALRAGAIVSVAGLTALMLAGELRAERTSLPRVVYVLGVSGMALLALVSRDPFVFVVPWSVQHWSAAMAVTSLAASGGADESRARWHRLLAPINRHGWAVLLALAVISLLLLPVMEVEAVDDGYVYADRVFGELARWLRSAAFAPALVALGFATGFIHYLLDRAAFRFSSPDVRSAARGLLMRPSHGE